MDEDIVTILIGSAVGVGIVWFLIISVVPKKIIGKAEAIN